MGISFVVILCNVLCVEICNWLCTVSNCQFSLLNLLIRQKIFLEKRDHGWHGFLVQTYRALFIKTRSTDVVFPSKVLSCMTGLELLPPYVSIDSSYHHLSVSILSLLQHSLPLNARLSGFLFFYRILFSTTEKYPVVIRIVVGL